MFTEKKFNSVLDTVREMQNLIFKYSNSPFLEKFKNYTIPEIFDFIAKDVRYITDPMNVKYLNGGSIELLRSPEQTLISMAGDCDCKSILAGSIFEKYKIPYRIVISSNKPDKKFHHTYLEIMKNNKFQPFDATYNYNKLYSEKPFTAKQTF